MNEETTTPDLTPEDLADKLSQEKKGPVTYTNAELKKAMDSLSLVTTLLLTGMASGQQTPGTKSFYAHFLNKMRLQWTGRLPTAAVSITDKINFYINPIFFNGLDTLAQMELVEHEIEHIVYLHPLRAKDYISTDKNASGRFKCANIAMDAYINENKPNLCADLGVTYKRLNKQLKEMGSPFQVSKDDPWEVNYEKLMQAAKDNPNKGDGEGFGDPIDDHSEWGESSNVSKEVAESIVRDAANKAQAQTGAGKMPSHLLRQISELNKSTVNWKRELRKFFVNSLKFDFERTRNRRNRRYGLVQPGRRKKPNLHVAICVDSSGSVYDAAFAQFFAEIDTIADMGVELTIIDADSAVAAIYKYEKRKPVQRHGNGGTAYSPAIEAAKKLGVDGIIYMGDMDSSDTPTNPGVPFLWAIVGGQEPPAAFGSKVRIEVERE
jgi:predicted metal-dependent peptidase